MIGRMTAPSGYRAVDLPRERGTEMLDVDSWAFAFSVRPDEVGATMDSFPFERGRAMEITDASRGPVGTLAAVHSSFEFHMRVPGGATVPTAGLTWVGVHQGHRRRGLLTAMIAEHFERSRARGEAVSTLFAAEAGIYQRFGYGLAARDLRMKLGRKPELRDAPGSGDFTVTLETASLEEHGPIVRACQKTLDRPGTNATIPDALLSNMLLDQESDRENGEPRRIVTIRDGGTVVAWATFRRKCDWNKSEANGIVTVAAWGATSAPSSHRLWSVLTDLDLMVSTRARGVALDDPLVPLLVDERAAKPEIRDNLWLRILDVTAAIEGRAYESDADVVIALSDSQISANAGTWRVTIAAGAASVEPAGNADADLALSIQELGAAYLGGVTLEGLANAGLVSEISTGAVRQLSRAMAGSVAPVCSISF